MNAVEQIASKFEHLLRRELGDNYAIVVEANKTSGDVCHAHDHCDANEIMVWAFTQVMGYEPQPLEDQDDTMPTDQDMMESAYNIWRNSTK